MKRRRHCIVDWENHGVPVPIQERVKELCASSYDLDMLEPALRHAIEGTQYVVYRGDNHLAILRRAAVITDGITL